MRDSELPPIELAYDDPGPLAFSEDALPIIHPHVVASDQIVDAITMLERREHVFTSWPFPDLDALTGQMAPGDVWFLCAASGGGKTTFVCSAITRWQLAGKRVYVMPLETKPKAFRTYMACMAAGVHPGDVLSGEYLRYPNAAAIRDMLRDTFLAQGHEPYVDQIMVSEQRAITLGGLELGLKEAKAFGADVVVVDHIDHIEGGEGANTFSEAKRISDGALRMAQDNELLLLFTSQLNTSVSKGDYLAKYMPPRRDHVLFGALKENVCTGMIGLFRPLRKQRPDEGYDEYVNAIKQARSGIGTLSVTDVLEPNTMGVVAMKLRNYGAREGQKAYLWVDRGRVHPMREADRYSTAGGFVRQHI